MSIYQVDPLDTSFVQVLNRILFDTTLSMGARLTYAALVDHYRANDKCWPSMARLASMVGVKSARTIQNYMQELIRRGLVTVIKRGCWKRANEYRLHALVPPRTSPGSQLEDMRNQYRQDMRNQYRQDMRTRPAVQTYQTNIRINNWKRKVNEAGAVAFIQRELARKANKKGP